MFINNNNNTRMMCLSLCKYIPILYNTYIQIMIVAYAQEK